jgi:hypothetical protein
MRFIHLYAFSMRSYAFSIRVFYTLKLVFYTFKCAFYTFIMRSVYVHNAFGIRSYTSCVGERGALVYKSLWDAIDANWQPFSSIHVEGDCYDIIVFACNDLLKCKVTAIRHLILNVFSESVLLCIRVQPPICLCFLVQFGILAKAVSKHDPLEGKGIQSGLLIRCQGFPFAPNTLRPLPNLVPVVHNIVPRKCNTRIHRILDDTNRLSKRVQVWRRIY